MKALTATLIVALIASNINIQSAWAVTDAPVSIEPETGIDPNSRIYRISPEEYEQIKPMLRDGEANGTMLVAQLSTNNLEPAPDTNSTNTIPAGTNVVIVPPPVTDQTPIPVGGSVEIRGSDRCCGGFDGLVGDLGGIDMPSNEGAIVIFVVIGAVVVLSVVVYAAAFIYEAALGSDEVDYWWDVEAHGALLFGKGSDGYMTGARFSSGFANHHARLGLVLEGGYLDTEIGQDSPLGPMLISSAYGMAGAGVRWMLGGYENNPTFLGVELLGGTATAEDVDLMSAARGTVSLGITENARLGFTLGALYMGLDKDEGIVQDIDNFSTMIGMQAGYRF